MIFTENNEFMGIEPDDSTKLQKHMKRYWFYKAWRIRAAPDQKTILLQKIVDFQFPNGVPEFAVESVDFIEKSDSTTPRNPCATNHLLILFASSGHWCGLACQIH